MRRSPLLDVLLGRTKQQILAATLLQPERSWYLLELARHIRVRPSSLQRDLRQLVDAGILKRRQDGNRVYFQADRACPVFAELAQILFKTAGVVDALQKALAHLRNQIDVAFVYGSIASSSERSASDIDLMVIGSASLARIAPQLRDLERQLGRAINPTVYGRKEFTMRVRSDNHFLNSVISEEPLFIIGGSDELGKLTSCAKDQTTQNKPTRARRPAQRR